MRRSLDRYVMVWAVVVKQVKIQDPRGDTGGDDASTVDWIDGQLRRCAPHGLPRR